MHCCIYVYIFVSFFIDIDEGSTKNALWVWYMLTRHRILGCGRIAMVKLLKACVMDDLKYNRYEDIAQSALDMSNKMSSTDDEFFQEQLVLIVEQVVQKLVRTMPSSQVKLQNPGVQNTRQFMEALLAKDGLDLPSQLRSQLSSLATLFTVDDKTILPNEILDLVKAVRDPDANARVFLVMTSLPQGNALLNEAETTAQKRMASESNLLDLGDVTSKIGEEEQKMKNTSAMNMDQGVDTVVELWDRLTKLDTDLKDKPESKNVADLKCRLMEVARFYVTCHVESELGNYIASQSAHGHNKMKCLDVPHWKVLALRRLLPDENVFRCAGPKMFFSDTVMRHTHDPNIVTLFFLFASHGASSCWSFPTSRH